MIFTADRKRWNQIPVKFVQQLANALTKGVDWGGSNKYDIYQNVGAKAEGAGACMNIPEEEFRRVMDEIKKTIEPLQEQIQTEITQIINTRKL